MSPSSVSRTWNTTPPVAPLTQASFLPSLVEQDPYALKRLEVNTTHYILLVYVVSYLVRLLFSLPGEFSGQYECKKSPHLSFISPHVVILLFAHRLKSSCSLPCRARLMLKLWASGSLGASRMFSRDSGCEYCKSLSVSSRPVPKEGLVPSIYRNSKEIMLTASGWRVGRDWRSGTNWRYYLTLVVIP